MPAGSLQTQDLDATVLPEMAIERERPGYATCVEYGEGDRVAQRPVLVDVSRQDVLRLLLLGRQHGDDGQLAGEQPLTRDSASELAEQQRVGLGFDVVRDEAGATLGGDLPGDFDGARVVSVVRVDEREDRAGVPQHAARHSSRIACLSRAPGACPPPRPAPTSRKMG